ncbi:MAG TPA: hypothetical protein VKB58_10090 [Terriglobales bacterium]|jgi:hypothetical protein|nr:hypothetical protein [Terriglobales bacterium]
MRALIVLAFVFALVPSGLAQDWKQVHKKDEAKWAKATGLDPAAIHKMWRAASQTSDESEDDSRIANIDLDGLAERHDVMLVTYAGEKNCLAITVFRQLGETQFSKVWSLQQGPDGKGFCDTSFGSAKAEALHGAVLVRSPRATSDGADTVYSYQWNGISYRMSGQKQVQ